MSVKLSLAVPQFEPQTPAMEIDFQFLHSNPQAKYTTALDSVEKLSEIWIVYLQAIPIPTAWK